MKERPILFSGPMVRALLSGVKTQTRRVCSFREHVGMIGPRGTDNDPESWGFEDGNTGVWWVLARGHCDDRHCGTCSLPCPYGETGDRLWVRERIDRHDEPGDDRCGSRYAADGTPTVADAWPWQRAFLPPMHMPRGLCRIVLAVTSVRVERLQEITEDDAIAEGVESHVGPSGTYYGPVDSYLTGAFAFMRLWDAINGKRPGCSWGDNPWVWVVGFEVVR